MRTPIRKPLALLALAVSAALSSAAQASDLFSVYELARQSDPQLQAAEAQSRAAGEGVVQARASLLPQLNAQATVTDNDGDSTSVGTFPTPGGGVQFGQQTGSSNTRNRDYSINLQQSLYNHQNFTRLRGARAERSRSEATYDAALDNLFIRVSTAYFDALTATTNLDAARAEEKAVGRQLEQAEQRFEVGLTAITDVHEARARYDSARANVILAQNQVDDAYEALNELTGAPVENLKTLEPEIPMSLPEPADPEQWVDVAIKQSPALAARRFAVDGAEQSIETAKAGHYPTLSLQAGYSDGATWGTRQSSQVSFPATSTSEGTSISMILNVPIFAGFATQSQVRQAVFNRDAAADQLEQERRNTVRQVRNAYRAVEAGMSEVQARKQALVSAQSALEATQAGFEVGTRTIVDVLLSQQQLFAAQREYSRSRHNFIVAGLRLKQAAGVIDVADIQTVNALLTDAPPPAEDAPAKG
jgi:outer membrane protein